MAFRILSKIKLFHKSVNYYRGFHVSPTSYKLVQFVLSDIGEGIKEVTIRDWFVKVGDTVAQFNDICLVESDKASVNITSRFDGTIKKLHYNVGDLALVGKPLVDIEIDDAVSSSSSDSENETTDAKSTSIEKPRETVQIEEHQTEMYTNKALATPAVRRIAMENNIKLSNVKGTGKNGRVMKEDILNYIESLKSTTDVTVKEESLEDRIERITGIKKIMVHTMTKANLIPTFGYHDEIDVTKLIKIRSEIRDLAKRKGISISYMPFFIKALSKALEKHPEVNISVDEQCENIIYKSQHNIGFAMDTAAGLIVPNIKNCQNLSVMQIAAEMNRIMKSGKNGIFSPNDLKNGTITISNIGIIGGTYTHPIILPPESAIVGLGKMQPTPYLDDKGELKIKNILYVSWSADHRVVDGATIAKFCNVWKDYLENPLTLALDL